MQRGGVPWYNIGLDETNNDTYPAIYTAAFSSFSSDTTLRDELYGKTRKNHEQTRNGHRDIKRLLNGRDFRFLFYSKADLKLIRPWKKWGIITASLIFGQPRRDRVNILIDGEQNQRSYDFVKDIVSDITGLSKKSINVRSGARLDRKIKLVNIADEIAHWLYDTKTLSRLSHDPHRGKLLYNELSDYL